MFNLKKQAYNYYSLKQKLFLLLTGKKTSSIIWSGEPGKPVIAYYNQPNKFIKIIVLKKKRIPLQPVLGKIFKKS